MRVQNNRAWVYTKHGCIQNMSAYKTWVYTKHGCIQNMGVYKTTIFNLVPLTIDSDWKTIRVSEKQ